MACSELSRYLQSRRVYTSRKSRDRQERLLILHPACGSRLEANFDNYPGSVLAVDAANDVALIRLDSPFAPHLAAVLSGQDIGSHAKMAKISVALPHPMAAVVMAGFPLGRPYPVAQAGAVAAITGPLREVPGNAKILLSLVANHGNSGGPIFDGQGNVIGLLEGALPSVPGVADSAVAVSGLSVVVPSYYLVELLKTVVKSKP